jgi:alpha-D-xyloside xylohydrolase
MEISRSYTGIGSQEDEGFLTFLIYPDATSQSFEVYREYDRSTILSYDRSEESLSIELAGKKCPHVLQIALVNKPEKVMLDGNILQDSLDYKYDTQLKRLKIKTSKYDVGNYKIIM